MNLDDWERETLPLPFGLDLLHGGAHEECEGSAVVGPTYPDRVAAGIVTANRGNAVVLSRIEGTLRLIGVMCGKGSAAADRAEPGAEQSAMVTRHRLISSCSHGLQSVLLLFCRNLGEGRNSDSQRTLLDTGPRTSAGAFGTEREGKLPGETTPP
jgi:hypothetical protein